MLLCDSVSVVNLLCTYAVTCIATCFSVFLCLSSLMLINNYIGVHFANKLVIMSICTHNWESVMNLNNRMLNIDYKNQ